MDEKDIKKFSVILLALLLIVLSFIILRPIILAIIAGLILAYIFYPVYRKLLKLFREKNTTAAIMCIIILLVIFVPLWFLVPVVVKQVFDFYSFTQKANIADSIMNGLPSIFSSETFAREFGTAINNLISKTANLVLNSFSNALVNIPSIIIQMAVILFVFFFTLRDTEHLGSYVKSLSPLNKDLEEHLIRQFKDITFGVIYGHVIVGIVQGALAGIGFAIFSAPHVLLLTIIAMLASTIPFIGAWIIWLPVSIIMIASGNTNQGVGLLIYGIIFVSWIDNIIKPYLIAKRAGLHSVVVFVGMIGGLMIFGIIGLLLGPLILSYFLILIDLYKQKKLFA